MKKSFFLIAAVILISAVLAHAQEGPFFVEGRKIMEEVDKRNSCQFETTNVRMDITERSGRARIRRLMIYKNRKEDGSLQILFRFTSPEDVKRTGLLTLERKGRESDQWLYLPILKKNKRIAEISKKNNFMGTDFTFEDLRPEELSVHRYELIREEEFEGNACFVIAATPTPEEEKYSGYKSRLIWVRKDIYIPVRIEYTDTKGEHLKTETRRDIAELRPGLLRADLILMENLQKGQKTSLSVEKRDIMAKIPESKFNLIELEKGWE